MRENTGFCAISNPHRPDKELEAAIPTQNASPGHQITMAQRLKSFKDNFRAALAMGTPRAQHQRNPHPSHRQGSQHRRREPLCARKHSVSFDSERPNIILLTQQFQ